MLAPMKRPCVVENPAAPGTDEWARIMTASKVAGIVGESNYESPYSVWNLFHGIRVEDRSMEDRYRTGHAMEHALSWWWADQNPGSRLSRGEVQVTNPGLAFDNAATLDRIATRIGKTRSAKHSRCVQFKTVREYEEFSNLCEETIPVDWLVQMTWEMLISGLTENPAALVVAGPYYDWVTFDVAFSPEFAADLVRHVERFLGALDGPPPTPSSPRDYKIAKLRHPDIDPDLPPVTIDADTAAAWDRAKTAAKEAAAAKREADKAAEVAGAVILETLGAAATAVDADGYVVAKRAATKRGIVLRHVPLTEAA